MARVASHPVLTDRTLHTMPKPAILLAAMVPLALPGPALAQDESILDALRRFESATGAAPEAESIALTPAAPDAFTSIPAPRGRGRTPTPSWVSSRAACPRRCRPRPRPSSTDPIELEPETVQVRVAAPDGRAFETAYVTELASLYDPARGVAKLADRSAPRAPYERFWLGLATPALEGRVTSLTRSLRRPSAEMPQPPELRAQLEGLYGPPSRVEQTPDRLEMVWAWGEEGFIADLEGQPVRTVQHEAAPGEVHAIEHRPCVADPAAARADGAFRHPREKPIWPGCVAVYRFAYGAEIGSATLTTSLADHALARADRLEADRQIVERLLGEPAVPVAPSELPL